VSTANAIKVSGGVVKAPPPKVPLPPIRDELILFAAAPNEDGTPAWMIQDPVTNRFFRIGWIDFELLVNWADNDTLSLVRTVNQQTPLNVTQDDVKQLIKFLSDNQLLRLNTKADVAKTLTRAKNMQRSFLEALLHNYLFFRLPLVRPQRWLAALKPLLVRLNMPLLAGIIVAISVLGVYLASRQWDVFTHTLVDSMTWSGILGYAVAMVFAKTLHEMGHALVATRYGVRVAHMGVAFLVLFPMLYTDTGESWRLKDNRQRLAIASAGIGVELALAGIATLIWTLAPDGPFRNGMFFLATTSWVLTLAINASPFMRFDGYFIVSDILDLPNLHERSSALARTWMRRTLLGFDEKWPESFALPKRRALVVFALVTWVYRLMIFIGIALLVYFFFFKLLGILLMILELAWFIGKPVMKELEVWNKRRAEISVRRRWWFAASAVLLVFVLVFPFSSRISGYGWFHAQDQQLIHAPFAAQIVSMPTERFFKTGDVLFVLDSSMLSIAQGKSRQLAQARESQIAGLLGLPDGEAQRQTLNSQKAFYEAEEKLSVDELERLTLRAPFDGELHDVDHVLAPGVWVKPREPLAILVDRKAWVIDAFIAEADLARVTVGQEVRARLLSDPMAWTGGRIQSIDVSRTLVLPSPMLDATNGGPIATVPEQGREGKDAGQVVRDALFRVRIELDQPLPTQQVSTVRVSIEGRAESIATSVFRQVVSIFIRESGF
jgi:putative peptide zinc metalloprotease protein